MKVKFHQLAKLIILLIIFFIMGLSINPARAGGVYAFGGFFAYDDNQTESDYQGLSPNGSYGVKYVQTINDRFNIEIGVKHESSTGYREIGNGFNGVFTNFNLRLF